MKPFILLLVATLIPMSTQAATKSLPVQMKDIVFEDGVRRTTLRNQHCDFRMEIISDGQGQKHETVDSGRNVIKVSKGERYSICLYNPLPVRVAVNLTVDGLNSISGKPSGISDGAKWIIEPYSDLVIRGWQVGPNEARRFFFTDKTKSYAKWRSAFVQKDLAANCGVIGAAFFWNQEDLDRYFEQHATIINHPVPYAAEKCEVVPDVARSKEAATRPGQSEPLERETWRKAGASSVGSNSARAGRVDMPLAHPEPAGTGMGQRESHATTQVNFEFNRGMYRPSQALVVYYEFERQHTPNPFPNLSFAPEMP